MDCSGIEDITTIREMKKDFNMMIGNRSKRGRERLSFSDTSTYENSASSSSSVTMQQFIDKQRQEKEKQTELIEVKTQLAKLQAEHTSLQANLQQTCVQHDKIVAELNHKHSNDRQSLSTLKDQLHKLLVKDESMQTKLSASRAELAKTTHNYEQELLALQKEKYKLQMAIQESEQATHNKLQDLRKTNLRQVSELNICQLELQETKQQLQLAHKRCSTTSSQLQDAEETSHRALRAEQRVKDLEQQLSELEGERIIARSMKDQLDRLGCLESENYKLRNENNYCKQTQDNAFLLREEVDSLKKKLERSESRCEEFSKLQIENKELREKLSQWDVLKDGKSNRSLCPKEMSRRVSDLQCSNASLLERQGLLQASVHSLEKEMINKDQQLKLIQSKLSRHQAQTKEDDQLINRLKRKLLLVSKERDSYKSMVEFYDKSNPTPPHPSSEQQQVTLQNYQRLITSLESELEQKGQELSQAITLSKEYEMELEKHGQQSTSFSMQADCNVLMQLREQISAAEKRLEEVEEEKAELEARLERAHIQGVYEADRTKVITMTLNPFSLARKRRRDEIENIVEDNKRLKTRVQVIKENQFELEDITEKVSLQLQQPGVDSKQIKELEDQIKSAELKNQRLMEVFKKKSNELREVFYRLLGYMIQIPCDNQYKLINMYAESPEHFILFQQSDSGDLQLLETPYSATLTDKMEVYLTNSNSIPAFLSSLTMDLFSGRTMM